MSDRVINIEIKLPSYPQCGCGGDMVPVVKGHRDGSEKYIGRGELPESRINMNVVSADLYWKCVWCDKQVPEGKTND